MPTALPSSVLTAPATTARPPASAPAPRAPVPARTGVRPQRDPFVDGIRVAGTLLVVALHWLMVEATWDGHVLRVGNALAHGDAWVLTWLQPLPLLFFAAGAAARYDLLRHPGRPGWRFAGARLLRMARPVAVFAVAWAGMLVLLPRLGVPGAAVERVARIAPQPLWFLAVQLGLLAVTPLALRVLARWGPVRVLTVLVALPLAADVLRFSDVVPTAGLVNVLLVWAVPYVGGLVHAQRHVRGATTAGRARLSAERTVLALLVAAGLAATVLLLATGPYPASLIGMPGDAISNLGPPTAPVVGFAVAQVAAALLLRDAIARWASRSRACRWVGPRAMGLYLWHLPAMFAVAGVVLLAADGGLPEPWTAAWWLSRPLHLTAAALVLAALVTSATRVERLLTAGAGRARAGRTTRPPLARRDGAFLRG
ncbi:acyltransferase family protein [Cellulomonas fimi]|uniref:Acyltransferase 3 domain-containing protein n=1 Tax=Cellulomonas fimi (strain ATCC 484 / DSM 20113 / JCM 1341 / CCUG 24087 / LMG 16345 / NBRC 15513 / NCIMB 8980 / NCTC 7547 / NRS-133) TaxID=590998 RepID=F4H3I8_CELFA|nr:acyltransferase [Cellulomonas fimi]AEE46533.1 hypothetical protein Celf_2406 [Cellulomonas fimi ATCC 484]NNH08739.1 acyltransferase family protein [Cellulomonas fimi]VEH33379.1 Fucose 4-O-acetylase and related acetyltransferases [Cellulomonas fimi]